LQAQKALFVNRRAQEEDEQGWKNHRDAFRLPVDSIRVLASKMDLPAYQKGGIEAKRALWSDAPQAPQVKQQRVVLAKADELEVDAYLFKAKFDVRA